MIIKLKKFGSTLTSRDDGKEAVAAFKSSLNDVSRQEIVEVDFSGVNTFTPSWGDEFLTPLFELFNDKLNLINTDNYSVQATLKLLEKIQDIKFNIR